MNLKIELANLSIRYARVTMERQRLADEARAIERRLTELQAIIDAAEAQPTAAHPAGEPAPQARPASPTAPSTGDEE